MDRYLLFALAAFFGVFAVLAYRTRDRTRQGKGIKGRRDGAMMSGAWAVALLIAAVMQLAVRAPSPSCLGQPAFGVLGLVGYVSTVLPAAATLLWVWLVPSERLRHVAVYAILEQAPWVMRVSLTAFSLAWLLAAPGLTGATCLVS